MLFISSYISSFKHYLLFYTALEFALDQGILVNVDNYQELEVVTEIMNNLGQVHVHNYSYVEFFLIALYRNFETHFPHLAKVLNAVEWYPQLTVSN